MSCSPRISASPRPAPSSSSSFVLAALGLVVALALLAGVGIGIGLGLALDQLEVAQQLGRQRRERRLVVEREAERVEIGAGFLLDPVARPERVPARAASGGASPVSRSRTISPTAEPKGTSSRLRALTSGSVLSRISARPARLARTPAMPRAPSASTRACSAASNTARATSSAGAWRGVQRRIVVAEPERRGVGEAARLGHLLRPEARAPASAP